VCKILIYVTHIDYSDVVYTDVGRWLRVVYPVVYRSSGFFIMVSGMIG